MTGQTQASQICYRAFELMKAKQYEDAEKLLAHHLAKDEEEISRALFHSALGVLHKLRGDYKEAWRHYSRAEKLLPQDPALKIISAELLLEQFSQYSDALKRVKKVLEIVPKNPVFCHLAHTLMGRIYLKKGEKKKALEALEGSIAKDFDGFVSAKNINFQLVEGLLKRGWGEEVCYRFLEKAHHFAKAKKEEEFAAIFQKMLDAFQT